MSFFFNHYFSNYLYTAGQPDPGVPALGQRGRVGRFQGVQDSDHDQNVDHVLDPADRISHQRQRDQGNDHPSHRDQAADEDHEAQGKNLRHLHDGQADNSQSRVADGNQELGFQHYPEGIGELTAKVGNVFKKPAKEVGLQKRLAEGLHFF